MVYSAPQDWGRGWGEDFWILGLKLLAFKQLSPEIHSCLPVTAFYS